ncbi:transposase [Microtetraspora sp. NBRC 16547]|uniref:IS66 family transposase n=1 Tax=Microtetraspora sp. NBRC 16547 TaxID=3030993 RepID=UPI0024A5D7D5|nr:transposase [Microtetraspora sp. NBRC 16547]GLW99360.1 hypothetical protein Misp02_34470 [Microtetraspora sp. NBRC 16547]
MAGKNRWLHVAATTTPTAYHIDLTTAWPSRLRRSGSCPASPPNLALRLRERKAEVLRFAADFTVAFSNNVAEQAIRMIKTKTKVSGGFRTLKGAQAFLAVRGYISTARKNGLRAAQALYDALIGNPWTPELTS